MLSNFCLKIFNNKNLLMLFSVCIYVLALVSVLTSTLFLFSFCLLIFSILFIVKKYFPIKYIIIWNLLFYVGVLNLSFRLKDVDELSNLAPLNSEITGVIVSIPQGIAESNPKFFFNIENLKSGSLEKKFKNEKILINGDFNFNEDDLKIYNSLKIKGRLAAPFKAGNPFQFDYGDYLRNHNTYAVFYARDIELVKKELSLKSKILQEISNYRENVIKRHSKYLDSPYLEILGGIVFGDDAISPSKDIKHSFINSGLLHILAASGMNVAFIYGFFFLILSRLRLNFRFNILFSMLMVVIYTFMTGLGASIIRAASMLLFILIVKLIDRDAHSISLLFFVGLLMLLYNPLFINDVGFQLSFVVTFGILLMSQYIIKFKNKVFDFIASIVIIPIIAQLWVIPIQIFYFNNICIYSIFANIMSVPLLMLISFGGFVSALLIGIIPLCADLICKIFDFILAPLLKCLVMISDFWGDLPNSVIQTIHPSIFQILLYYTFLFFITLFFNKVYRDKFLKKILGIVIGILKLLHLMLVMRIVF